MHTRPALALRHAVRDWKRIVGIAGCASIALVALAAHVYALKSLPRGFMFDEAAIAYNAHLIETTGRDEHRVAWPVVFESTGDYKNALYIYLVALIFKLFGYSELNTRAASALCWVGGSSFLYMLGRRLFSASSSRLYLLLCLGFTPWLFTLSRISFELIVLYPLLGLYLLAVHHAYEELDAPGSRLWALLSGMAIGLCLYGYSTFRLLAPVHALLVLLCYPGRRYWRRHVQFGAAALLAALPYIAFALQGGLAKLTVRFHKLTYLYDAGLDNSSKFVLFVDRYLGYFGWRFLAANGDPNTRHHTGQYGELLPPSYAMLLLGAALLLKTERAWRRPFVRLLFGGLLAAPIAAALTRDEAHSLRAFSMVIFAILLSTFGVQRLEQGRSTHWLASVVLLLTAACATVYTRHYFRDYPEMSESALENYGFKQAFLRARKLATGKIVVSLKGHGMHVETLFFDSVLPTTGSPVPVQNGTFQDVQPGDVYIFSSGPGTPELYREGLPPRTRYGVRRFGE
jgi:hypothetical protein